MKREKSIFRLDGKAMTIEINDYGFSQNSAENFQWMLDETAGKMYLPAMSFLREEELKCCIGFLSCRLFCPCSWPPGSMTRW